MDQELYAELLVGTGQPVNAAAYALTRWQHFSAWNDVMAAIFKVRRQTKNLTLSFDAYLLEEQPCQISSQSDLNWQSLRLFFEECRPNNNKTVTIWDQLLI